jgi:hypothetical protein
VVRRGRLPSLVARSELRALTPATRADPIGVVTAPSAEFTYSFVDARLMAWLLDASAAAPLNFEANGVRLVVWVRRRSLPGLVPLFAAAAGFARRVPPMVPRGHAVTSPDQ